MVTVNIVSRGNVVNWFFFSFLLFHSRANTVRDKYDPWCESKHKTVICKNTEKTFRASVAICRYDGLHCKNCVSSANLRQHLTSICSLGAYLPFPFSHNESYRALLEDYDLLVPEKIVKLKHIAKRQTKGPEICGNIEPPKPGKVSCKVTANEITCIGMCDEGYKFKDGPFEETRYCTESEGLWKPQKDFPPCEPQCEPRCQNGGLCQAVNICTCSNEYRGEACQYPIALCSLLKTDSPSSWQCSHTRSESVCDVTCHPPGSSEAELNYLKHSCDIHGQWSPPLPPCVSSYVSAIRCPYPDSISNGRLENFVADFYPSGARISFACDDGFVLTGEKHQICGSDGVWNGDKPVCNKASPDPGFCPTLTSPHNAAILRVFTESQLRTDSSPETLSSSGASKSTLPSGSKVQYKCLSKFYKLYGSEYQTCLPSGIWSGNRPTCVPVCGISDLPRTPFIVHGKSTELGQWPWQVGLSLLNMKTKQWRLMCGGSLITERWVLTAAHCVTRTHSSAPLDRHSLSAHCGKYFRSLEKDDDHVQTKKILQIIIHENYDFIRFDADIALLELESPVTLTSRVQTICLPTDDTTRENIRDAKKGVVIGWGLTEEGLYSEVLRESELPVVSHSRCEERYRVELRSITVTGNMFCAGHEDGRTDTCNGDSGGPMMFLDLSHRPTTWILEGIVSWGSEAGCGKAMQYSGFTKVRKFVDWINMYI